jgi:diadenosine tetraphosphate (Ap4A) HIT family hydrolase
MSTDLEKALNDGVAPWKHTEYQAKAFWAFGDETVPQKGYLCFVPTQNNTECIVKTLAAAYKWGQAGIRAKRWTGFNIVQSVGSVAGQGINYPHVHMIPRYEGDIEC